MKNEKRKWDEKLIGPIFGNVGQKKLAFCFQALHSVAKVYAVLPFYDVKCLCSGGWE